MKEAEEYGTGDWDPAVEKRRSRLLSFTAGVALVFLLAAVIPSPYVIQRPGPIVDIYGEGMIDGESRPIITVEGAKTYAPTGTLNLLTVSTLGSPDKPVSWLSLVPALFDPSQRIAPMSEFYPEGMTLADRETQTAIQMDSSQTQSAAAAFRDLGKDVGVSLAVAGISAGGPATDVLEPGDVLRRVNEKPISDFGMLREEIRGVAPGENLTLTLERGGEEKTVALVPRVPEGETEPVIGAVISTVYDLPATVNFGLSEIGGPSAGLVFALGLVDQLTEGNMLGDLTVSGTGTMAIDGQVGPIGGLTQKAWAASRAESDLFLMPMANCADALAGQLSRGLNIAPVETLDEAITVIENVVAGDSVAGLERCAAPSDHGE